VIPPRPGGGGNYELDLNRLEIPLSWKEVFGREAPVHLEIGSGKGRFSVEFALNHPEINYLSVERAPKYHRILLARTARRGAANIRLLQTTAEDLLFRLLPPESLDRIYILFPDPWPKKRHHKRRLISPEVVQALHLSLRPEAELLIKSDHPGYAEHISEVLNGASGFRKLDADDAFESLPLTGFELKYLRENRPIRSFALRKIEG